MFVSERGTLGEFNYGQSLVCRTMRPVLNSLAMEHHTATRLDEFEFIVDRSIKQAITTQAPVAPILSPLLTGGKAFEKGGKAHEHGNQPPCPQHQGDEPVRSHLAAGREAEEPRSRDRRHRQHQFRSVGTRPPAAEFLHAGHPPPRLPTFAPCAAGAPTPPPSPPD